MFIIIIKGLLYSLSIAPKFRNWNITQVDQYSKDGYENLRGPKLQNIETREKRMPRQSEEQEKGMCKSGTEDLCENR